ncbi:hypothetical protein OC846_002516 [Tilletia horrida]|uniref:ZZ-type domain-containing protein n=1 Tax=Tilletia horrida TaxID=155126 RepID=A0AAN6JS32_9BASI|nr:hypothetical protein OC845_003361 [Tilletia horrida]KAK0553466.1 hypothetical protein OC846_002516 [Tilletia horrida]KAK0568000.1 hypothetical protein OC861_002381 [Tilletia horrida]
MASDSNNKNKTLLGHLKIQVELSCPTHSSTSPRSSANVRKLPVFKTRVHSARETRRNIVDIIKRHIPSLQSFETLKVGFPQPKDFSGKVDGQSSKAAFESSIVKAVNSGEVFRLQVHPASNNSAKKKTCFCPEAVPTGPSAPQVESLYRQHYKQQLSEDISTVTPATITSKMQGLRKVGELTQQDKLTPEHHKEYLEAIKARTETDNKIKSGIAKYECVLARLKELEAEHTALKEKAEKDRSEGVENKALYEFALDQIKKAEADNKDLREKAEKLKTAQEEAEKVKATSSTQSAGPHMCSSGGQFQSFAHDLLKNLNASMSANFGDGLGTFQFAPSSPVMRGVAEPEQHEFGHPHRNFNVPTCRPRTHPRCGGQQIPPDNSPAQAPRNPPAAYNTGPDTIPLPGASFYCDICKRLVNGEDRFRCLRCNDWDACANCCLYGLHEHDHSAFLFLPANPMNKGVDVPESPLGSKCTRCDTECSLAGMYHYNSISEPEDKSSLCPKCFLDFASGGSRLFSSRWNKYKPADFVFVQRKSGDALEPPLHLVKTQLARPPRPATVDEVKQCGIRSLQHHCDLCNASIDAKNEWRYHCAKCADWDACMNCWDSRKVDLHHHPHFVEFAPTNDAGSRGSGCSSTAPELLGADPLKGVWPVTTAAARAPRTEPTSPQPHRHNATCDLCQEDIAGPRLKCLDCPDWDSCSKPTCAGQLPFRHPGHRFVQMEAPGQLRYYHRNAIIRPSPHKHMSIFCDGCDAPIIGTRYACIGCQDFDLCANCEALPVTNIKVLEEKKGVKQTKATAASHQLDHGSHHLFVKITGDAALRNGPASIFDSNKNVRIEDVLGRARSVVSSLVATGEKKTEMEKPSAEAASSAVPSDDPPRYMCGTSLYAAYLADQAAAKKKKEDEEKASAAAAKAKEETEKSSDAFKAAAGDNMFEQNAASFGSMTLGDVLRGLAATPRAGAAVEAPAAGPARRFLQEMFPLSSSTTNLPQTRPAPSELTKEAETSEASSSKKTKTSRGAVSIVHSMEPPRNQHLSYEEKRTLSVRVQRGGEAAMHAFLSALSPDQLEQVTADGELVFELDDLSSEQFYNIMTELDALEASQKDAMAAAEAAFKEMKTAESTTTAVAAAVPVSDEAAPAQMAELSSSFKTIRNAVPSKSDSRSSSSSVLDVQTTNKPAEDKRLDLDAEFVEDVSLPDGAVIAAGSRFDKVWRLRNSGKKPWPAGVRLKYVAGDSMGLTQSAGSAITTTQLSSSPSSLDDLAPGAECQIRLSALKAMEITGRSTAYFRLSAPGRGPYDSDMAFGHQLWIDIDVRAGEDDGAIAVAGGAVPAVAGTTSELGSNNSPEHSVGRLGGSSVFTAPHAPESVRSDTGASAVADATSAAGDDAAPASDGDNSVAKKTKTLRGFRLDDDSDSESEDEDDHQAAGERNPFEDAVDGAASDEEDATYVSGHVLDDVSDDSDFELVDPTTEEESDIE